MTASSSVSPPRWAVIAAHAVLLITLPSGIWRIFAGFGFNLGFTDEFWGPNMPGWGTVYVIALSVVAEGLALLTLGLVQPWGERVPSWIPLLGGRAVRPWAAIVPATLGGLALTAIWTPMIVVPFFGDTSPSPDEAHGWWAALMAVCYVPLIAWGPLLLAVTYAYWRRRRPTRTGSVALEHRSAGLQPGHGYAEG